MLLRIDIRQAPPDVRLLEQEDFGSFKAVVVLGSHTWVAPRTLQELCPGADATWQARLEGMVAYAQQQGWTDESGRIRAHVELAQEQPS